VFPQDRSQQVMLFLGPADPGLPAEQQAVAAARGDPFQLQARPVQQD
jgi:hypothetical protein